MGRSDPVLEKIRKRSQDFQGWRERMRADRLLYYLDQYYVKRYDNTLFNDAYNYTSNRPQTYADAVQADLLEATVYPKVESDELDEDKCVEVANMAEELRRAVDHRCQLLHKKSAEKFYNEQIAIRGCIAGRLMCVKDSNNQNLLTTDYLPWDPLAITWEDGPNGELLWASMELECSPEVAKALFTGDSEEDLKAQKLIDAEAKDARTIKFIEYFDAKKQIFFVNYERVYEVDNAFGFVPVIIIPSEIGVASTLNDEDRKHWGESIYWNLREQFQLRNHVASVTLSQGTEGWRSALTMKGAQPGVYPPRFPQMPRRAGGSPGSTGSPILRMPGNVEVNRLYPLEDTTNSMQMAWQIVNEDEQTGQYSNVDYGQLVSSELSGKALKMLSTKRKRILSHLTRAKALFYETLVDMGFQQMRDLKLSGKIGPRGKRKMWKGTDIPEDYYLEYQIVSSPPEEQVGRYALGSEARDMGLPRQYIFSEVMELQNAAELDRQGAMEDLGQLYPEFRLLNAARDAEKQGDNVIKRLAMMRLGYEIDAQRLQLHKIKKELEGLPQDESGAESTDINKALGNAEKIRENDRVQQSVSGSRAGRNQQKGQTRMPRAGQATRDSFGANSKVAEGVGNEGTRKEVSNA